MQITSKVPVLILGYARTENIRKMVLKLMQNHIRTIYVSLDYAEDIVVRKRQTELISELKSLKRRNEIDLKIWYRSRNHGIASSIITALDWFFNENPEGIVLEDDLEFEKQFLDFCTLSLDRYKTESEIWMISGNRFNFSDSNTATASTNYPQIWGWATWRDRWIQMREAITANKKLNLRELGNPAYCFLYVGATRAQAGIIDTWDLPLAFEMYIQEKMCILPPCNLVSNVGSDVYSVHTKEGNFPLHFPISRIGRVDFSSVEELKVANSEMNRFIELNVFKMSLKHVLSVPKLWVLTVFNVFSRKTGKSLAVKLTEADKFEEF